MHGQIISRGKNTWLVRVPIGRSATGTRLHHNKTLHGTKKDAQRYLTRVLRELDTGAFVQPTARTLNDFMRECLDGPVKQRVRDKTLEDYEGLAKRHILPLLGHRRLDQLTPAEIQAAYGKLAVKGLSARTIRYAHSVLHGTLEQAVKWGYLARNPAKLVDLPRMERAPMRSLTRTDATRFLSAMEGTRWEALWVLLISTGLRPGEALALRWVDVDGGRLKVQRALVRRNDGRYIFAEPKTDRARRAVTLPGSVIAVLNQHHELQDKERAIAGETWNDLGLIFAAANGEPLDFRCTVSRYFRPIIKKLGLSVRPYDLRHTCATLLLSAGENIKVVSERLGHASSTLTLDVYSHVLPDMQQKAAERLEELLFSPPEADEDEAN